uniref:Peroxiredoxin 6 n=1 Tax=Myotis myotis TaxID=51298 RepID=A0A7J7SSS5_MYOMY|nr:peroxiredoxin 6 [Myotis myotis]
MPGGLLLGDEAPNFEANTTVGRIRFHDFLGDSWGILFSHPRDFTPVCTTELGRAAKLAPEFAKRNVKLIALSIDSVEDHLAWSKDINAYNCEEPTEKLPFPIIDDRNRDLAILLGMLDPAEKDEKGMPVTARVVGDSVMVLPTIPEEEAKKLFPKGVFTKDLPSGKKYLRYTPQP